MANRNDEGFQLVVLAESILFVYVLVSDICFVCTALGFLPPHCEMTVCAEGVTLRVMKAACLSTLSVGVIR